ncbi:MAG: hypothetical protein ACOYON_15070 [Fimbriimonas sp.]
MKNSGRDMQDLFQDFLGGCAKFLLIVGGIAFVGSLALLIFSVFQVSGNPSLVADAMRNVGVLKQVLTVGVVAVAVGSTFLFWGEEILGAVHLIVAAAMFFAPLYLDGMLGESSDVKASVLGAIQNSGGILGVIGIVVLVVDLAGRARNRMQQGTKADQLKYGKNIQQEKERQNVFLGKCWQLPFCRKFVRERCPIYHAKVTCWRERVGCMCEEEVIRNAMDNKPIPKDELLARKYIPQNNKFTLEQKKERCRQCVIYNEHQRHKYRALLPAVVAGFVVLYVLFRTPLLTSTNSLIEGLNKLVSVGTLGAASKVVTPPFFIEFLLICLLIVCLSYALKVLEFCIFKLKI